MGSIFAKILNGIEAIRGRKAVTPAAAQVVSTHGYEAFDQARTESQFFALTRNQRRPPVFVPRVPTEYQANGDTNIFDVVVSNTPAVPIFNEVWQVFRTHEDNINGLDLRLSAKGYDRIPVDSFLYDERPLEPSIPAFTPAFLGGYNAIMRSTGTFDGNPSTGDIGRVLIINGFGNSYFKIAADDLNGPYIIEGWGQTLAITGISGSFLSTDVVSDSLISPTITGQVIYWNAGSNILYVKITSGATGFGVGDTVYKDAGNHGVVSTADNNVAMVKKALGGTFVMPSFGTGLTMEKRKGNPTEVAGSAPYPPTYSVFKTYEIASRDWMWYANNQIYIGSIQRLRLTGVAGTFAVGDTVTAPSTASGVVVAWDSVNSLLSLRLGPTATTPWFIATNVATGPSGSGTVAGFDSMLTVRASGAGGGIDIAYGTVYQINFKRAITGTTDYSLFNALDFVAGTTQTRRLGFDYWSSAKITLKDGGAKTASQSFPISGTSSIDLWSEMALVDGFEGDTGFSPSTIANLTLQLNVIPGGDDLLVSAINLVTAPGSALVELWDLGTLGGSLPAGNLNLTGLPGSLSAAEVRIPDGYSSDVVVAGSPLDSLKIFASEFPLQNGLKTYAMPVGMATFGVLDRQSNPASGNGKLTPGNFYALRIRANKDINFCVFPGGNIPGQLQVWGHPNDAFGGTYTNGKAYYLDLGDGHTLHPILVGGQECNSYFRLYCADDVILTCLVPVSAGGGGSAPAFSLIGPDADYGTTLAPAERRVSTQGDSLVVSPMDKTQLALIFSPPRIERYGDEFKTRPALLQKGGYILMEEGTLDVIATSRNEVQNFLQMSYLHQTKDTYR